MSLLARYTDWLHGRWPAGTVEPLPEVGEDGATAVPGLRIAGDLTGIPLLKFAVDSGVRAVRAFTREPGFAAGQDNTLDLAILGAGPAGIAAALEARSAGLRFAVFEASRPFATIADFPRGKPIFTYPTDMTPAGDLRLTGETRELLLDELEAQRRAAAIEPVTMRVMRIERREGAFALRHDGGEVRARRVLVAIGRGGNHRRLGVPGEELDKVHNRLHDPADYAGRRVLVVGGGDSALEATIALAAAGAEVTHSYRRPEFVRPKPQIVRKLRALSDNQCRLELGSRVVEIREGQIVLEHTDGARNTIPNDVVFVMIGREPPLGFFRDSGVPIRGEWRRSTKAAFAAFLLLCVALYHWKSPAVELPIRAWFERRGWFPFSIGAWFDELGGAVAEASRQSGTLLHTLRESMRDSGFYYSLAYCLCVVAFGIRRIRRRRTPYVRWQTITLMLVQCIPLFLLPQILLPWLGRNGWFESGAALGGVADVLFERYDQVGHERAYWRAYGFVLAWPLFVYNVFTDQPMGAWLAISLVQTFVIIPLIVWRWGKGAYCGWICSCGALAETLGDEHRHKMPHGPRWNRLNMVGQAILAVAALLLLLRVIGWVWPGSRVGAVFYGLFTQVPVTNYRWIVDIMLAGVVGLGCYFWLSGRVWCRFACPLAALMHIYARFSRFRIFADKPRCISCNVCTSVCHQGIDVMNFANKGRPMEDPQCVRCSACVQSCPTGVLSFGRLTVNGRAVPDRWEARSVGGK